MLKLNLETEDNTIEYSIPNGWDEVTINQYQELMKLKDMDYNNIELYIRIITILSDIDRDMVEDIPASDFKSITDALSFTQELITSNEIKESIILNEEEYFLKKDFDNLTLGEQASIEILMKKYDSKLELAIKELLCIFLRKKKENGKLEKFKTSFMERSELFGEVYIGDIYQLFLFF